ncbi:MAG: riboflavin synthase subunit alpha [Polyangiales bacterium]
MFTGIVQGTAVVRQIEDLSGLRRLQLQGVAGFTRELEIGASVSVDGACLTVSAVSQSELASFDVIQETLSLTTLGSLVEGASVNVERAAREGAEIGGHAVSGHIDTRAQVAEIRTPDNNRTLRFSVPSPWIRYIFAKGYVALDGASLTVSAVDRAAGWFEVCLIPETLRITGLGHKQVGDHVNLEIERGTQVFVDTVRETLEEKLNKWLPALEQLLLERGGSLDELISPEAMRKLGQGKPD